MVIFFPLHFIVWLGFLPVFCFNQRGNKRKQWRQEAERWVNRANRRQMMLFTSVLMDSCRVGRMSSTLRIRSRKAIPADWGPKSTRRINHMFESGGVEFRLLIKHLQTGKKLSKNWIVPWPSWCNHLTAVQWCHSLAERQLWPPPWRIYTLCHRCGPAQLWAQARKGNNELII